VLAERAVGLFTPEALLFVGVAGGLKDEAALGDVVVATRVYAYHGGKEGTNEFQARPRAWEASHYLEQLARQVARTRSWARLLPDRAKENPPAVHFKPIAAGEVRASA
jgi:adenosylhomocysteine nucleosidase